MVGLDISVDRASDDAQYSGCLDPAAANIARPRRQQPLSYYVVDWLPPDFGAVGQYGLLFASQLARDGRQVCLLGLTTGSPGLESEVFLGGGRLETRRLPSRTYNKASRLARIVWTLRTNSRLTFELLRQRGMRNAEVLFTGAPPFMLFFVMLVKLTRGARLTYRITDFHPEALMAELGRTPWTLNVLLHLTWFLRRRVDRFEVLGEDQRRLLMKNGIAADRIILKRDVAPVTITGRETPAERPPQLRGYKLLLYSGNYGVAHDVETVVEGLRLHHRHGTGRFALWLNAVGSKVDSIAERLTRVKVPFFRSDPVLLAELPHLLAAADVHLIALRSEFAGLVLPSKIYACIASRRPILFVGPEESDVHLLADQSKQPYERVEPGSPVDFAGALDNFELVLRGDADSQSARASRVVTEGA